MHFRVLVMYSSDGTDLSFVTKSFDCHSFSSLVFIVFYVFVHRGDGRNRIGSKENGDVRPIELEYSQHPSTAVDRPLRLGNRHTNNNIIIVYTIWQLCTAEAAAFHRDDHGNRTPLQRRFEKSVVPSVAVESLASRWSTLSAVSRWADNVTKGTSCPWWRGPCGRRTWRRGSCDLATRRAGLARLSFFFIHFHHCASSPWPRPPARDRLCSPPSPPGGAD